MSPKRHTALIVVAAAAVLVGGANLAVHAANGGPLLLGKGNVASKSTKLKTTGNGPALKLKSKSGTPSLAVSSPAKVAKLNADRVDDLEGAALATTPTIYKITDIATVHTGTLQYEVPVPAGSVLFSFAGAITPSSTGVQSLCGFSTTGPGNYTFGTDGAYFTGGYGGAFMSGTSVQTFTAPTSVRFFCNTGAATFHVENDTKMQFEITKLTGSTTGTLPPPL